MEALFFSLYFSIYAMLSKTATLRKLIWGFGQAWACLGRVCRGRNNGQSTDMTSQILPFYHPEFSVIIEMNGHFFSSATGVVVRNSIITTFKQIPHFFTGDNLITISCSVHIQLHQIIKPLLTDIES